jgi:hypothetical protein
MWKLTGVEIGGMEGNVGDTPFSTRRLERMQKSLRFVDGHHSPGRADHFCKIKRSVARAAANIQHRLTRTNSGGTPRVKGAFPPNSMLQAEAFDFFIMRA